MLTEEFKITAFDRLMNNPEELKKSLKKVQKDRWIARAAHLLQELEFSGTDIDYGDLDDYWGMPWEDPCCPCCRMADEHTKDCELHKLLEEAEEMNI